jgi:hypothetical protein
MINMINKINLFGEAKNHVNHVKIYKSIYFDITLSIGLN